MRYRKIMVTGSGAVLGSAVRAISGGYPAAEFIFLTSADADLTDLQATADIVGRYEPDAILHLAAVSGGIGLSASHHASMLRDNTLMTFAVMEAARIHRTAKLVMTLTTGMYPVNSPLPLNEDNIHDGWPHKSNYGSSFAKRMIDPAIRAYREEYGMNVIGLVPSGIFGENDNFNYDDAPMVPSLIRRFHENRLTEKPITIWGDGTPLREYTYARDLARIYLWCLEHYDEAQVLNIGTTEENSVADIAFMVADIMGIDHGRVTFDTSKPKGIFRKPTDNRRFMQLSHFQYTPFRIGLEKTIAWYDDMVRSNPAAIRTYAKCRAR